MILICWLFIIHSPGRCSWMDMPPVWSSLSYYKRSPHKLHHHISTANYNFFTLRNHVQFLHHIGVSNFCTRLVCNLLFVVAALLEAILPLFTFVMVLMYQLIRFITPSLWPSSCKNWIFRSFRLQNRKNFKITHLDFERLHTDCMIIVRSLLSSG
jgi:hypothetical protein